MKLRRPHLLAPLPLLLAACLADDRKGEEDDIPVDGKDDSFVNPTPHGALVFGTSTGAAFTDTQGFHTWTFKLTASASVDLRTQLDTANLDTVMYLYKRTSSSASWGEALDKNDDESDDSAASRLRKNLTKGEYRVLIKAYKRIQRGSFSLEGTCTGAGCATTPACEPPVALPGDTGFGGQCAPKLAAIFQTGVVQSSSSVELSPAERCSAPALHRAAIDYYKSYFDLDDETSLSVDARVLEGSGTAGGTLVDVTDGGDESGMTFVFDRGNKLVALYQSNQSPDLQFFCRAGSAQVIEHPELTECMSQLFNYAGHTAASSTAVSLVAAPNNLPAGLGAEVSGPMRRFSASNGTSATTKLTVSGARWGEYTKLSRLSIKTSSIAATEYLASDERVVFEIPPGSPAKLVCE